MPIDTAAGRRSIAHMLGGVVLPEASGTLSESARAHVTGLYAGLDYGVIVPPPVPSTATNDEDCILLLKCDDFWNTDTIVNSAIGGIAKSCQLNYGAELSRANDKFGESSLLCEGGGQCVSVIANFDWNFAADEFSVDCWAYVRDPLKAFLWSWWLDSDNLFALERVDSQGGAVRFGLRFVEGSSQVFACDGAEHVAVANGWHHFAVTRDADGIRLYVDGELHCEETWADAPMMQLGILDLLIGKSLQFGGTELQSFDGYIDEFRVSRTADFTAAFAPLTVPYPARRSGEHAGRFRTRRTNAATDVGAYACVRRNRTSAQLGAYHVRRKHAPESIGTHRVRRNQTADTVGAHGVVRRWRNAEMVGLHNVRRNQTATDTGEFQNLTGVFGGESVGGYRTRRKHTATADGRYAIKRRYSVDMQGVHRIEKTALDLYELYYGNGSPPNLDAAPWQTYGSLPITTPTITGEGLHYLVLRKRNRWNLQSRNILNEVIELNASDERIPLVPSNPEAIAIQPAESGKVRIDASYPYTMDGVLQATDWLIYIRSNGTDPDPSVDTPVVVSMQKGGGLALLSYLSGSYSNGATIKTIVRVRRIGSPTRDSVNTAIVQTTASTIAPNMPQVRTYQRVGKVYQVPLP